MPPPPPPPAPPPPTSFEASLPLNKNSRVDRSALLSDIRLGTKLKKTVTKDRSAPQISASKRTNEGSTEKVNCPVGIGGLFAQGMPRLRPTGNRPTGPQVPRDKSTFNTRVQSTTPNFHSQQTGMSHSQPPSPVMPSRQTMVTCTPDSIANDIVQPSHYAFGLTHKFPSPNDLSSSQAPPSTSWKHGLRNNSCNQSVVPNCAASSLPMKHSRVSTGLHQSTRREAPRRPPPSVRPPPPPPKSLRGPPPPPSKPPSLMRRQSFGAQEVRNGISSHYHNVSQQGIKNLKNQAPPPPPSRNQSVPNNLNQIHFQSDSKRASGKLRTAPPPPSTASKVVPSANRPAPPPPPVRTPSVAPPLPQTVPCYIKAPPPDVLPPPPPARNSSVITDNFESRFTNKFHDISNLIPPSPFQNTPKTYPSKNFQNNRRRHQPPTPPPSSKNLSGPQPKLQVHLTRPFANRISEC
ncbi:uncharacterized protein LOC143252534 [Tachypleus tridentatus]|uniref:uncharacterized protein LOC143252534 n=1 Tax=Tachypleus tridentatus TaxID=6853 RepID=UPI003FD2C02C